MDLIKIARGLDREGPGENGENLTALWTELSESADSQFHATEESTLRWLLKTMSGASSAAETMRRYPLTWTILDCIFRRMPLFSLAKAFADRKFIPILQQSVQELAKSHDAAAAKPGKRKRSAEVKFDLESLKATGARLESARCLFPALRALLERLEPTTGASSHDKIGAEHVRSLFSMSAKEATTIAAPLLTICELAFESGEADDYDGCEQWISTISLIWDLHFQGDEDAIEVATHLLGNATMLFSTLKGLTTEDVQLKSPTRNRWTSDLQSLLQRTVIQQAKAAFINQQSFQILSTAIEVHRQKIDCLIPALYDLITSASVSAEARRRKGETEWMVKVFVTFEQAFRDRKDREILLKGLLNRAIERSMPVDLEHLRVVCRQYALTTTDTTNWDIIALAATCDPDIFQVTDTAKDLLRLVCDKVAEGVASGDKYDSQVKTVTAILRGFRTSRDMSGFLKLWYTQLCKAESNDSSLQSPWFYVCQASDEESLSATIERDVSAQQLLDLLNWVVTTGVQPQALSIFLAAVSQGISTDAYADAVSGRVFELSQVLEDSSPWTTALKWRVVSRALSWFPSEMRAQAWGTIQKPLAKVLKKGEVESADCFEAFKCCCQAWTSMRPDDSSVQQPLSLLETFSKRLTSQIAKKGLPETAGLDLASATDYDLRKGPTLQSYVAWYARGSSRLTHLAFGEKQPTPVLTELAAQVTTSSIDTVKALWGAALQNDQTWQDSAVTPEVVDRLITSLDGSRKANEWPGVGARKWLQLILGIPSDAISREQREKIMVILEKCVTNLTKQAKHVDTDDWRCYLSLALKIMLRPTFYDSMQFDDLVSIVDALGNFLTQSETVDETYLEFIERVFHVACATIGQLSEHVTERSLEYFRGSQAFIVQTKSLLSQAKTEAINILPLRLTLMKALTMQLSQSSGCRGNEELSALLEETRKATPKLLSLLLDQWANDKKLFSKHNHLSSFGLFAGLDAAHGLGASHDLTALKSSKAQKLDLRSSESMEEGDLRGWSMQVFLRTYLPASVSQQQPAQLPGLGGVPVRLREEVVTRMMAAITKDMDRTQMLQYLKTLIGKVSDGDHGHNSQVMAIDKLVSQVIGCSGPEAAGGPYTMATAYGELIQCLPRMTNRADAGRLCRILHNILEKSPQALGQWNIELTLESVCELSSNGNASLVVPFTASCNLVGIVIKKHRLRLEGHYHLLTTLLQALLRTLIESSSTLDTQKSTAQVAHAQAWSRLITLICEPTAGAVSRAQQNNSLESATDVAKRSAGLHMYLVLMQYVKLQLESGVTRPVREALEPAMNSIFDITPPEGRKILNDAMNASGRAILREMFKRYTKFGKWSGV